MDRGVEIHHDGDLPGRSGMGSSSSFTVGLLHALYALQGRAVGKKQLAGESIHIEQDVLKETVGSQDQVCAAYGGLNRISFLPNGDFTVQPMTLTPGAAGGIEFPPDAVLHRHQAHGVRTSPPATSAAWRSAPRC